VAYLRDYVEWLGMMLRISPDVLVPRPETELLAEEAIRIARERRLTACADIGTGSGCIAIALARALPEARVQATDISPAALEVARMNAAALGVSERISLGPGPLLAPLTREPQLITANLPYLSDEMMRHLPQDVRHEPVLALHGGRDGLELYAGLVDEMHERRWRPALLLEIDPRQAGTALRLLRDRGLRDVRILGDYAGLDRIIVVDA
jgi:release factor glutamine methyltransferase